MHFLEHGRSPDVRVTRWQDRITPLPRRVGRLSSDRPIDGLVAGAELEITQLDHHYVTGPEALGHLFAGVATKP